FFQKICVQKNTYIGKYIELKEQDEGDSNKGVKRFLLTSGKGGEEAKYVSFDFLMNEYPDTKIILHKDDSRRPFSLEEFKDKIKIDSLDHCSMILKEDESAAILKFA
ncbi:hypothetical protein PMAYCL1PPCAC_23220, partial [Pristionchus mayeri]